METIKKYKRFIIEYKLKIWDIINNDMIPSLKEILESYDEIREFKIRMIDREYNTRNDGDIDDCFLFIRLFPEDKSEDFSKVTKQIVQRIESEFKDDIYLISNAIDNGVCELMYCTTN